MLTGQFEPLLNPSTEKKKHYHNERIHGQGIEHNS